MNGRTMKAVVEGVTPAWGRIRNRVPETGRYLVESDVETRATVALLGQKIKKEVFGDEEALGREVLIRGVRFRIVGVLKQFGNRQVQDGEMERDNMKIYIPLTTAQKYFVGTDTVHAWAFKADPEKMADAQKEAEALMRRSHRGITDFKIENIGEEILRVRKEVDKLIAQLERGAGLDRRHLAARRRHRHLLRDADLDQRAHCTRSACASRSAPPTPRSSASS